MTEPAFAIAGSGRSGSGYIARVLTSCGVRCGHEEWFNPVNVRVKGLVCDSSWCVVDELERYSGTLLLQVRHPLKVISSFSRVWSREDEYWAMKDRTMDGAPPDQLGAAMKCWLVTNQKALDRCEEWWRLEDIDIFQVQHLCEMMGVEVSRELAGQVLKSTSRRVNEHSRGPTLAFDQLPNNEWKAGIAELAPGLGYEL